MLVPDLNTALAAAFRASPVEGVVSAYVFGSHASGRTHRESDLDVGVLLDRSIHNTQPARFNARLRLTAHVAHEVGIDRVDLVVLNDAPPHLTRRIMTEGIQVYCVDPEADHAVRRTALLRAADLESFLGRTRRIKLTSIAR